MLLATVLSLLLLPPLHPRIREIPGFILFFLTHSLRGGLDVARRAFEPNISIEPDLLAYPLRLAPGLPQVLMSNIVGLLPGTLGTSLEANVLTVHVLDGRSDFLSEIEAVEERIARMFAQSLRESN